MGKMELESSPPPPSLSTNSKPTPHRVCAHCVPARAQGRVHIASFSPCESSNCLTLYLSNVPNGSDQPSSKTPG